MMSVELPIRKWRITKAIPSGIHVFVDLRMEDVRLFSRDPSPDGDEVSLEPDVAEEGPESYLDKVGSVSACENEDEPYVQDFSEQLEITNRDLELPSWWWTLGR